MKIYMLKTHEPIVTAMWATAEPPTLYATREVAESAAKEYNEGFRDEEPATVVEIELCEGALKELVAEPEHFVNALVQNSCTPEEVVAFLNEPAEESDEAA